MAFSKRAIQIENFCRDEDQVIEHHHLITIFDQSYKPIYRYIFRHLGDRETSKELTSEVFKRLVMTCQKRPIVKPQVSPWLYRTANNLLIDHYRKSNHRNHLPLAEETVGDSMLPPEIVDKKISADYVRKALTLLTEEQRTVIILKYLEGKSNREIAEVLEKSVGAVKAMQHRALNSLRRMLSEVIEG